MVTRQWRAAVGTKCLTHSQADSIAVVNFEIIPEWILADCATDPGYTGATASCDAKAAIPQGALSTQEWQQDPNQQWREH